MTNRRRKNRVGEWRNYYRFRRFQNVTTQLLLLAGLLGLLMSLLTWTTGAQSLRGLAQALNTYSNLALTLLAFVTVVATLAYVHVTQSILKEMIEARRAEVRPFVRVTLLTPEFKIDNEHEPRLLHMHVAVQIANHGRGPAIGVRVHVTVPCAQDESGMPKDWIGTDLQWSRPPILEAAGTLDGKAHVFMPEYELPEKFSEFVEIEARYEDTHQGLYCLRQYYDLFNYGASERKFMLTLRYEALYYFPYERRKSIRDTDMGEPLAWGEEPVHERKVSG